MARTSRSIAKIWAAKKLHRILTCDIEKTHAFKLGIIDASGKQLIKNRDMTPHQRNVFTPFERIGMHIRRILIRHGVSTFATALTFLEEQRLDDFDSVVMNLETADDLKQLYQLAEDTPTTTASQVAGYAKKLYGKKKDDEDDE